MILSTWSYDFFLKCILVSCLPFNFVAFAEVDIIRKLHTRKYFQEKSYEYIQDVIYKTHQMVSSI